MVYEHYFNPEYMGYIKEGNFVKESSHKNENPPSFSKLPYCSKTLSFFLF